MNIHVNADLQYHVQPRENEVRLDSQAAVPVMAMGFPPYLVRQAIEGRHTATGLFSVFHF